MRGVHSSSDADGDMADSVAADCQDVVVIEEDTNAEDTRANGSRPKTASFIPAVLIAVVGIVPIMTAELSKSESSSS